MLQTVVALASKHLGDPVTAFPTGPFVCAAFLCETVLTEQNGVHSFIRVVDVFTRAVEMAPGESTFEPQHVQATLAVALKAGEARGSFDIALRLEKPSGEQQSIGGVNVHFDGGPGRGSNLIIALDLELDQEGLWWIDVLGGDEQKVMTRIPAELRIQRIRPTGLSQEP